MVKCSWCGFDKDLKEERKARAARGWHKVEKWRDDLAEEIICINCVRERLRGEM